MDIHYILRIEKLRQEIFDAIDYDRIMTGGAYRSHQEGELQLIYPHRLINEYQIKLYCLAIAPNGHYSWCGESFSECLDKAEADIKRWIKAHHEAWKGAEL